jgi:hypothetical protein
MALKTACLPRFDLFLLTLYSNLKLDDKRAYECISEGLFATTLGGDKGLFPPMIDVTRFSN